MVRIVNTDRVVCGSPVSYCEMACDRCGTSAPAREYDATEFSIGLVRASLPASWEKVLEGRYEKTYCPKCKKRQ